MCYLEADLKCLLEYLLLVRLTFKILAIEVLKSSATVKLKIISTTNKFKLWHLNIK